MHSFLWQQEKDLSSSWQNWPPRKQNERGWVKTKAAVSENTFYPFGFVKFFSKPISL